VQSGAQPFPKPSLADGRTVTEVASEWRVSRQFIIWRQPGACINWAAFKRTEGDGCGWHGLTPTQGQVYSLLPYAGDDGCQGNWPISQVMTGMTSHEYVESASDPVPLTGWTDQTVQYELADLYKNYPFVAGPNGEYVTYVFVGSACIFSYNITYDWSFVSEHAHRTSFPNMSSLHAYSWYAERFDLNANGVGYFTNSGYWVTVTVV
jgi:hypothetical protein